MAAVIIVRKRRRNGSAGSRDAGLFRHVGEGAVTLVTEEPVFARRVHDVDVGLPVAIIIDDGE